ncbi:hypothetical protein B0H19DRAFT_1096364 [Mycena capillaripes]|nr:hypothetical protein B0H19DRAFT_1096364 [Mycena capillaripes]
MYSRARISSWQSVDCCPVVPTLEAGLLRWCFFLSLLPFCSTSRAIRTMAGVELLFGPLLIGVVLNMMLYGVVCIQIFTYFQRYPNDSTWIRCLMTYLLIVETANVFVEFGIIFQPLILQFGQQAAIDIIPKLLPGDSIIISIVAAPIQLFTAWRISVITGSYILSVFIGLLSLGSFGFGITVSLMVSMNPEFRNFGRFQTVIIVWLVLSAVCDIVIAIGMTYALTKRRTGFGAVDGQINRIVRLTVETGALTAVTALVDVGLFLGFPGTSLNFVADFPLSGLYTCSILAMLNSRQRQKPGDTEHAYTAPQILTQDRSTLKSRTPRTSFHGSNKSRAIEIPTGREKVLATDNSDTASEKTFVSHRHPDFYNHTTQKSDGPTNTDGATSQISLPSDPKPDFYNYNATQDVPIISSSDDAPRSFPTRPIRDPTSPPRSRSNSVTGSQISFPASFPANPQRDPPRSRTPTEPSRSRTPTEPPRSRTPTNGSGASSQKTLPGNAPQAQIAPLRTRANSGGAASQKGLPANGQRGHSRTRTISGGAGSQKSLPANPRPTRPALPLPEQLGQRPRTIVALDQPAPERF